MTQHLPRDLEIRSASRLAGGLSAPLVLAAVLFTAPAFATDEPTPAPVPGASAGPSTAMPADCPMHAQHMAAAGASQEVADKAADNSAEGAVATAPPGHDHHADVNARGEQGMGFSQTATTHHFLILADGGEIRVEANEAQDSKSRDQIRRHLFEVARSFAAGDFRTPMFIHGQLPPGVPTLERLGAAVDYAYADTVHGGRVRIRSANAEAIRAIQEFLRFQIEEHQTGDPLQPVS